MNSGRAQSNDDDLKEPKRKKIKPGTILKDPYPIIFWNKLGIPPCSDLWPSYAGIFDGESVVVEDPGDMNEIYSMGYFGRRMLYRRGYEPNVGDIPVLKERQWKRRVEWAAEFGYVLIPQGDSPDGSSVGSDSQGDAIPDTASKSVKTETLEKENKISGCDEACTSTVNGKKVKVPKSFDQSSERDGKIIGIKQNIVENIDSDDSGSHGDSCIIIQKGKSATDDKIAQEMCRSEADVGAEIEFDGSGNGSNLNNDVSAKHSGLETNTTEQLDKSEREGEDERIVEDSAQPEFDDENERKDSENKKGDCERANTSKADKAEIGMTGEANVSDSSLEDISAKDEGDAVKMDVIKCVEVEKKHSNKKRTDIELEVGEAEERSRSDKKNSESRKEKECPDVREDNLHEMEGEDNVEKDMGGKMAVREEVCAKKTTLIDKEEDTVECKGKAVDTNEDRDTVEECRENVKHVEIKKNAVKSSVSSDGEGNVTLRTLEQETEGAKGEDDVRQSSNTSDMKTDVNSQADNDVKKMGKGKEVEASRMAKENQKEGDLTLSIDRGILDDEVKITENESFTEVEVEEEEDCQEKNAPDLNESGISVEIIDDENEDSVSVDTSSNNLNERLKEISRKRNLDDRHSVNVSEIDLDEEEDAGEDKVDKTGEHKNMSKRKKTSDVSIVEVTDSDEKLAGGDIKNTEQKKEGIGSIVKNLQETENEKNSEQTRSSPNEKDLNDSIKDCEIVEIEEKRMSDHGGESSINSSLERKLVGENPQCSDSDDDIMEVSVEEEDISNVKNKNKSCIKSKNKNIEAVAQTKESEKTSRYQELLVEIRKKLPSDIEVMEVDERKLTAKSSGRKNSTHNRGKRNASEKTEDDDIIEIDLQSSDILESESCNDDDLLECDQSSYNENFQRKRRERSNYKRTERDLQKSGRMPEDEVKSEVEEIEDQQSLLSQVKLESDCDASPCIVLPDSGTEDENSEVQGLPRLESDPSVYLPSLDVLRLLPEEAFFLAYGLGCLQVWDGRNVDNSEDSDEALSEEENGRSAKGDISDIGKQSSEDVAIKKEDVVIKKEADKKNTNSKQCDKSISESKNNSLSSPILVKEETTEIAVDTPVGIVTEFSGNSLSGSISIAGEKENLNSSEQESKSTSGPNKDRKSVEKGKDEVTSDNLLSPNEFSKDSSAKSLPFRSENNGGSTDSNLCREGLQNDVLVDRIIEEGNSHESNHTPANKKRTDEPSTETADFNDINTELKHLDKLPGKRNNCQGTDNVTNRDSNEKSKTNVKSTSVRENGELEDSSVTIIDLADSPPSRQWANRGGWSASDDDDDDVVAMDCNNPHMPYMDSRTRASEMFNASLHVGNEDPMSLIDLWNSFRSIRSSTSQFATPFETSYAVYHHFRAKRWVVKPGIRFGGDFLLYKDGPAFYHASYLVIIDSSGYEEKSRLTWNTLAGLNRLAENVAKDLMLCRVEWPQSITEEELRNPKCLKGLTIQEILLRRWVSVKERDGDEEEFKLDKDDEFIPLEL